VIATLSEGFTSRHFSVESTAILFGKRSRYNSSYLAGLIYKDCDFEGVHTILRVDSKSEQSEMTLEGEFSVGYGKEHIEKIMKRITPLISCAGKVRARSLNLK
jgi:hypothetical protein